MTAWLRPLAVGLLGAILGTFLVLAVWHLWDDHRALHVLIQIESQRQAAARQAPANAGGDRP